MPVGPRGRQALGLPDPAVLRDPARLDRVRSLIASAQGSAVLAGLVHLAGDVANADSAQLSLLADVQHATVIQCCEPTPWQQTSDVDDSLVAARHPPPPLAARPATSAHRSRRGLPRGTAATHRRHRRRCAVRQRAATQNLDRA